MSDTDPRPRAATAPRPSSTRSGLLRRLKDLLAGRRRPKGKKKGNPNIYPLY